MATANHSQKLSLRQMIGFFIACAISSAASNAAHPVTPTLFISLNFPDYMFGVALACNLGGIFMFSPFWGKLNSYVSSRWIMGIGCLGYAFAQILFGLGTTQTAIIIARLICGIFCAAWFVGQLTYIVNKSEDDSSRGRNLTFLATLNSVFSAFGFMLGGLIGDFGVRISIWTQVGMLITSAIIYMATCQDDNEMTLSDADRKTLIREGNPFASFKAAGQFLTPIFFGLFMMAMLQNLAQTCFDQSFNYYTKAEFGFTTGQTGLIKGSMGVITLIANTTLCTYLMRRTNIRKTVIPVLLFCAAATFTLTVLKSVPTFIVTTVLLFAVSSVSVPILQDIVANYGKGEQAGMVMGFYNSMKYLGGVIGALTGGFAYNIMPKLPFRAACFVYLAAAVLAVMTVRAKKPENTLS